MATEPIAGNGMNPVAVIGAGISGLMTAFFLKQHGIPVVVLEKDDRPGGTMKTERENGWLIETGPNSTLETTPLFRQLFRDLNLETQLTYADPSGNLRFIVRNGQLRLLPTGLGSFLVTGLWSFPGKLRLLREPFIGRGKGEESIAEFVERRLGREFLDYAINPFVAGVYAGDPRSLSVQWAFPKLYALEAKYGGLIKGVLGGRRERKQRAEKAKDRAEMFSFRDGMEVLPQALARALGSSIELGCTIDTLGESDNRREILYHKAGQQHRLAVSAAVLSVPAHAAAKFIAPVSTSLASSLSSISYPPVAEVFLGFHREQIKRSLKGFGFLMPEIERRKILGTIWSSSLFPGRTPGEGYVALTTFVGGARQPALALESDEQILTNTMDNLQSLMNIQGPPVFTKIRKWEKAIPQYNVGYGEVLRSIDEFEERHPGMFFCGNYRGGIAVGDCVMSAEKTAENVAEYLKKYSGK